MDGTAECDIRLNREVSDSCRMRFISHSQKSLIPESAKVHVSAELLGSAVQSHELQV